MFGALLLTTAFAACPFKGMAEVASPTLRRRTDEHLAHEARLKATAPTPGTTTVKGCTCKNACGPTIEDGFNCDWCYTDGKCGHYSYTRFAYYDYCVYKSQKQYEDQTFQQKQDFLWNKITADPARGKYEDKLKVVAESMQTTFDTEWDWMPAGRFKVIHAVGTVCQVEMEITDGAYTGILDRGVQKGLFRFGSATDPVGDVLNPGLVNPGAGFKFLRTGVSSANWVMLDDPNHTKTSDFNLWARNMTNHVSAFQGVQAAVAVKFGQATNCVTKIGLSNLATHKQDGTKVDKPVFPWELKVVPTGAASMSSAKTDVDGFMKELIASIPDGKDFYTVMAKSSPFANYEKIGTMRAMGNCVTSNYGDNQLFFRHQRVEEDWTLRPEWWKSARSQIKEQCGSDVKTLTPPAKCIDHQDAFLAAVAPTKELKTLEQANL